MYPNKGRLLRESAIRDGGVVRGRYSNASEGSLWGPEKDRLGRSGCLGRVCWQRSTRRPRGCRSGCSLLSVPLGARTVHPTTACTVRWSFCDSSFAIMGLKAPSEPSGSQELRARRAAPGPHGTRPPSHSACGCQPSFRFSAAGLFHPARLDWPLLPFVHYYCCA
jgi:hypothetical protein